MTKALPKKVFVCWNDGRPNDDPWLQVSANETDLAEMDTRIRVGVYELKQTAMLVNGSVLTELKK